MLLHEKVQTQSSEKKPQQKQSAIDPEGIILHPSKLNYTLLSNQKEWEQDIIYFKTVYSQMLSMANKGNMKNSAKAKGVRNLLATMRSLIKDDSNGLNRKMEALADEFKNSDHPRMGTIFQDYADLEHQYQVLRNEFRMLTVDLLKEINKITPVKIF